jgi:hypothetical protein
MSGVTIRYVMGFWVIVFLQNLSQNAKNAVLENTAEIQNSAASKCTE